VTANTAVTVNNIAPTLSSISGLPIARERLESIPETTVLAAEKVSGIGGR
jgi:hypothetical protein